MQTTQEPLLMLGPVYSHWDSSYETYHAFFAHPWCKWDNINFSGLEFSVWDLIVGSDEERAWKVFRISTVRYNWPMSVHASQAFSIAHCTDSEDFQRALTKAVETCFPKATTLLCCRHLEENVRWRLQDKVGLPVEVQQDIVSRVFGAEGLAVGCFRMTLDSFGRFLVWPQSNIARIQPA